MCAREIERVEAEGVNWVDAVSFYILACDPTHSFMSTISVLYSPFTRLASVHILAIAFSNSSLFNDPVVVPFRKSP